MTAPGYRLDEAALEAAYKAYLDCPIDMCGDHDEECEKTVRAAIVAYLAAAPQPEPPADIVERAREFWRRLALVTGGLCDDDDEVEAIAAFAQEHAVAEKARADKAEKALADIVDTWTRAHTAPEDATAIRARKGGGDE